MMKFIASIFFCYHQQTSDNMFLQNVQGVSESFLPTNVIHPKTIKCKKKPRNEASNHKYIKRTYP